MVTEADEGDRAAMPRSGVIRVAMQGERGAYSEDALQQCWGGGAEPLPRRTCEEVAAAVDAGSADAGILPLDNSIAGTVTASYEALIAFPRLHAVREIVIPIHHCLLGVPGASVDTLRSVDSHPIALAQCRSFLDRRPHLWARAEYDTAGAAKAVADAGDPTRAAIAGRAAAACYGLDVLEADIEDRSDNQTRFVAVARTTAALEPGSDARSILVVATPNEPGALLRVLQPFADADLNLSKLESRPTGEPWKYWFIVEFEHQAGSDRAAAALEQVRGAALSVRLIGTFNR
jgi:prephenate dehydratase